MKIAPLTVLLLTGFLALETQAAETNAPAPQAATPAQVWTGIVTNKSGEVVTTITVDTSETPDLEAWGRNAGEEAVKWFPKIVELLNSPDFKPYKEVHISLKKDMGGVAATGRAHINISAGYVRNHKDDVGMVIHEMTHVIQAYPPGSPGWLVEGVADYVRLMHYEPQAPRPRVNPDRASYRDSYKTTAAFLNWVEKNHDAQLVPKLNRAMREQTFKIELFKDYTGKSVDDLWKDYTDSLRKKALDK